MNKVIVIRGGGDLATGAAHALCQCGLSVVILEIQQASAIRRKVSFCEAIYEKTVVVEGVTAELTVGPEEAAAKLASPTGGKIPLLIDPSCDFLNRAESCGLEVTALVDAIIAKRNVGTCKTMAPVTIALGPGFTAGPSQDADVDAVVETMRGHNLGRIIFNGSAMPNTGIPGTIAGYGKERVVHASSEGKIHLVRDIGDVVSKDAVIAIIESAHGPVSVYAPLTGVLRGIIHEGYTVSEGLKIADVDPRIEEKQNCFTISDKSRALGNAVLRALIMVSRRKGIDLW